MTTKERLIKMVVDKGMFEVQATKVIDLAISKIDDLIPDYKTTWDGPADGYPDTMYAVWNMTVTEVAKEWIEENCPDAWFKHMF